MLQKPKKLFMYREIRLSTLVRPENCMIALGGKFLAVVEVLGSVPVN